MRQDETGGHFPNDETGTRLLVSGPVVWENPGKICEKSGTGLLSTTQERSRVVPNFETFPGKTQFNRLKMNDKE